MGGNDADVWRGSSLILYNHLNFMQISDTIVVPDLIIIERMFQIQSLVKVIFTAAESKPRLLRIHTTSVLCY